MDCPSFEVASTLSFASLGRGALLGVALALRRGLGVLHTGLLLKGLHLILDGLVVLLGLLLLIRLFRLRRAGCFVRPLLPLSLSSASMTAAPVLNASPGFMMGFGLQQLGGLLSEAPGVVFLPSSIASFDAWAAN